MLDDKANYNTKIFERTKEKVFEKEINSVYVVVHTTMDSREKLIKIFKE